MTLYVLDDQLCNECQGANVTCLEAKPRTVTGNVEDSVVKVIGNFGPYPDLDRGIAANNGDYGTNSSSK